MNNKWYFSYGILSIAAIAFFALWLLSSADAKEKLFKNGFDLSGSLIHPAEIISGGVPRDGIPALTKPRFISAKEQTFLSDTDPVIGVRINGIAKAYPIKILNWHEVVNDRIGDTRYLVTYCPLCGSGIVFLSPQAGKPLYFGVSGLLYNSDVLLYDLQTESLWSQLLGKAITGNYRGEALTMLPSTQTTWGTWVKQYPKTLILSTETGYLRHYAENPYQRYAASDAILFGVAHKNSLYPNKTLVLGLKIKDKTRAYPFPELMATGLSSIPDRFDGKKLTIEWNPENRTARALDQTGKQIPGVISYWFAWYAFYPETSIFKAADTTHADKSSAGKTSEQSPYLPSRTPIPE